MVRKSLRALARPLGKLSQRSGFERARQTQLAEKFGF